MLSVFIPSFNHARYVTDAIASARRIAVPGKRIYVIDDASTDGSGTVITDYLAATNADDVTFIKKPENRGAIDSMLMFLSLCQTEYLYVVASDDIAIPDGIAELTRRMEATPSLQFIIGGGWNLMPDGSRTPLYGRRHQDLFSVPKEKLADDIFLVDSSPLLCQSSLFRRSALLDVDAVSPEIVADDYAIFAKLFQKFHAKGFDFDFAPEVGCVLYRHHGHNSYRNIMRQVATSVQVLEAVAPDRIRDRAIAYKLAFYLLVALKRRDSSSFNAIVKLIGRRHIPAIFSGIVLNAYLWGKYR